MKVVRMSTMCKAAAPRSSLEMNGGAKTLVLFLEATAKKQVRVVVRREAAGILATRREFVRCFDARYATVHRRIPVSCSSRGVAAAERTASRRACRCVARSCNSKRAC
jgi:hypothetical protein